jgi:serine-type D-Ala-D-Ala carboxypeptidase (penicillin-binding protein 5/6)
MHVAEHPTVTPPDPPAPPDPSAPPPARPYGLRRDRSWWKPVAIVVVTAMALGLVATRSPSAPEDSHAPLGVIDPDAASRGDVDDTGGPADVVAGDAGDVVGGIEASAYAVYDPANGTFLAARDLHERRAVGSLMKLLTAWVVIEAGDPERMVTVPRLTVGADESAIGLRAGETQRRDVLLRAMLIASANDAARALAVDVAGDLDAFAHRMNAAAEELGLSETRAVDPAGLDRSNQYSSAHDLVRLGEALMRDDEFRKTVARHEAHLHGEEHEATNDLLGTYFGADGTKTGHTDDAGWCLLASATRGDRRLFAVVLGAPSEEARDRDAARLLDWAFAMTSGG